MLKKALILLMVLAAALLPGAARALPAPYQVSVNDVPSSFSLSGFRQ